MDVEEMRESFHCFWNQMAEFIFLYIQKFFNICLDVAGRKIPYNQVNRHPLCLRKALSHSPMENGQKAGIYPA